VCSTIWRNNSVRSKRGEVMNDVYNVEGMAAERPRSRNLSFLAAPSQLSQARSSFRPSFSTPPPGLTSRDDSVCQPARLGVLPAVEVDSVVVIGVCGNAGSSMSTTDRQRTARACCKASPHVCWTKMQCCRLYAACKPLSRGRRVSSDASACIKMKRRTTRCGSG